MTDFTMMMIVWSVGVVFEFVLHGALRFLAGR